MKLDFNLIAFQDRFTEVLKRPEPMRSKDLTTLMNDMGQVYEIPTLRNEEFERKNIDVMPLYRAVDKARNFEEVES
ncbi:hypothetical protein [Lentibacillus saliphilus]|uniref:hypothetical protein n=1 Tax=Lentibacillus saliphilus TaxID=2737028 RepID=UPI001C305A64|nr:hypothetical protein [Lentibacillus saliphilus]